MAKAPDKTYDPFRPGGEPARTIYEALTAEARLRPKRQVDEWIQFEREAVHAAATQYASKSGVPAPTMAAVELAERCAMGHVDYAAKWAYGVAQAMSSK